MKEGTRIVGWIKKKAFSSPEDHYTQMANLEVDELVAAFDETLTGWNPAMEWAREDKLVAQFIVEELVRRLK